MARRGWRIGCAPAVRTEAAKRLSGKLRFASPWRLRCLMSLSRPWVSPVVDRRRSRCWDPGDGIGASLARGMSDDGASTARVVVQAAPPTTVGGWRELGWSSGPRDSALAPLERQDPDGADFDTGGERRQSRDAELLLEVDRRGLPSPPLCSNFAGAVFRRGHRRDKIPIGTADEEEACRWHRVRKRPL